jgi:ABC-type bacteriocin/lantibiotic exporter with double-glycine peptidase domain
MRTNVLRWPIFVLCACVFVCAAEPPAVWIDVPFVKQEKNACGAASIAMVMQFWQRQQGVSPNSESDSNQIQQALYSPGAHGIRASDMGHYFQQRGFLTFAFEGTPADLEQHLAKGRPLIVALKPGTAAPLHYVVVTGIDPEHNLVLLNDPAERKLLKQDMAGFEKEWKGTAHWTLLAVPQSEAASSAR